MNEPRKSILQIENQADIYKRYRCRRRRYELSVNERGTLFYLWSIIVSLCCVYNLLFITFLAYEDIRRYAYTAWIRFNIVTDVISLLDMCVQSRRSYYDNGCKIVSPSETRWNYIASYRFALDTFAILPTDLFLISHTNWSLLRLNRLFKCYRLRDMFDLAERRHRYQVIITFVKIVVTCSLIFHWNACAYYLLSNISLGIANKTRHELDQDDWPFNYWKITDAYVSPCRNFRYQSCGMDESKYYGKKREEYIEELFDYWRDKKQRIHFSNFSKQYSQSMYWSALTMTTLGEQKDPNLTFENIFEIFDTLVGMIIFAAIMGSVGDLVSTANAFKTESQMRMDGLKNLSPLLQERVLKYCEYEMTKQQKVTEMCVRSHLPEKLFIQVNKFLHWSTLKRSPLFESCEIPFLADLACRLTLMVFAPNDIVAAKDDLNKEMFVVSYGELRVVDSEINVIQRVKKSEFYGESSLIWLPGHKSDNRRILEVRSYGYTEVYVLHRDTLLHVLEDYPEERFNIYSRARLMHIAEGAIDDFFSLDETYEEKSLELQLLDLQSSIAQIEASLSERRILFNNQNDCFKQRLFYLESIFTTCRFEIRDDLRQRLTELDGAKKTRKS